MFGVHLRKPNPDAPGGGAHGRRQKIGIALGAGAARGWAHIGALAELSAMGVAPDIIVGSSVGAVVGGCFAAGKLDALDAFARSLTKRRVLGLLDVSLGGGGLIGGGRLRARLEESIGDCNIEDLPIQFAGVATELRSGHEIWLRRGSLVDAIRASYALPGVFEPVCIDGHWLIDGAIVNPVPISVARALGADQVIALTIAADGFGRGVTVPDLPPVEAIEPASSPPASGVVHGLRQRMGLVRRQLAHTGGAAPSLAAVMVDAFNITQDRIMRSRLAGDPADVMVTLRVGKIGLFEFHRADELIALGRDAVRKASAEILDVFALQKA